MPLGQLLLLKTPLFILGLIIVGGAVAFSIAGLLVVRHFVPHSRLKAHNDVADPILGILGAVYAVLLAFVVVTVWQAFEKSSSGVQQEANCLADMYRDAEAFSPDFRQKSSELLRSYRQAAVNYEWPAMASGKASTEADKAMRQIYSLYTTYEPRSLKEQSFFDESVIKLNMLRDLREQRLLDSRTGIHPLLYFVLVVGAIAVISFTFLFGTENIKAHIVMAALLAALISLILFTILSLDFPFTGSISVSAQSLNAVQLE